MTDPTYDFQQQWEDMDPTTAHINQQAARIEALEAQLAKAVDALDWIGNTMVMSMALNESDLIVKMKKEARTALAQIKGGE